MVVTCSVCSYALPYFPVLPDRPRIRVCSVAVMDLPVSSDPALMKSECA